MHKDNIGDGINGMARKVENENWSSCRLSYDLITKGHAVQKTEF